MQLELGLTSSAERVEAIMKYLEPLALEPRQQCALCVVFGFGRTVGLAGGDGVCLQVSRLRAGRLATQANLPIRSGKSFVRGAKELEGVRVMGILRTTTPWTYAICLLAMDRLKPRPKPSIEDRLSRLPIFDGSPKDADSGQAGTGDRVRDSRSIEDPCTVDPVTVHVASTLAERCRRPWDQRVGITSEDLVEAVETGDLTAVRALWKEALVLEWISGSEDDKIRFLSIIHHCATVKGLTRSRMGGVVSRVKKGCDVARIPNRSEQWAAGILRAAHSPAASVG